MGAATFFPCQSGARDQECDLMNVDDLAGAAAPGAGEAVLHGFKFLDGVAHMRAHADDAGVAPHQIADRAQQVLDVFVVGMFSLVCNRLMVRRLSSAGLLPHGDSCASAE